MHIAYTTVPRRPFPTHAKRFLSIRQFSLLLIVIQKTFKFVRTILCAHLALKDAFSMHERRANNGEAKNRAQMIQKEKKRRTTTNDTELSFQIACDPSSTCARSSTRTCQTSERNKNAPQWTDSGNLNIPKFTCNNFIFFSFFISFSLEIHSSAGALASQSVSIRTQLLIAEPIRCCCVRRRRRSAHENV